MSEQNFKAFELKVKPDEYGDLNKPLPDTVPKPNVGCGIRNDECFGLIFAWIVAPEEAMDYDSVEDTVKDVRLSLMEEYGSFGMQERVDRERAQVHLRHPENSGDSAGPAETGGVVSLEPECECRRG